VLTQPCFDPPASLYSSIMSNTGCTGARAFRVAGFVGGIYDADSGANEKFHDIRGAAVAYRKVRNVFAHSRVRISCQKNSRACSRRIAGVF
jgi:hypothetical protein